MSAKRLSGWTTTQRVTSTGAVESEQRVMVDAPVVPSSEAGACELAVRYWAEVGRLGRVLLAVREHAAGIEVRLLRWGPVLLALGPAEHEVSSTVTAASHPIIGGLLVRRGGGRISFEQSAGPPVELRSRITGFHPRRGPFYALVQRQLHVAVSRRYFRRLIGKAAP
jgi:hypothetical protein